MRKELHWPNIASNLTLQWMTAIRDCKANHKERNNAKLKCSLPRSLFSILVVIYSNLYQKIGKAVILISWCRLHMSSWPTTTYIKANAVTIAHSVPELGFVWNTFVVVYSAIGTNSIITTKYSSQTNHWKRCWRSTLISQFHYYECEQQTERDTHVLQLTYAENLQVHSPLDQSHSVWSLCDLPNDWPQSYEST